MLEFHVDDTTASDKEDTLIEMAFHVPPANEAWSAAAAEAAQGDGIPPAAAKVRLQQLAGSKSNMHAVLLQGSRPMQLLEG